MAAAEPKPSCKFGENCYRKNPQHLKQFRHPKRKHSEVTDVLIESPLDCHAVIRVIIVNDKKYMLRHQFSRLIVHVNTAFLKRINC